MHGHRPRGGRPAVHLHRTTSSKVVEPTLDTYIYLHTPSCNTHTSTSKILVAKLQFSNVVARCSPVRRVMRFWGSKRPSCMPGVLLVARAWKLYRNLADSIRGYVLGYLLWSQSSDLSGSLCFHASDLGNLPIIVSYPFTSFMSFVHLHIVHWNRMLSCWIYGPSSKDHREQWDQV
jgi:hypothetical protein